jgi:hypothetical protein
MDERHRWRLRGLLRRARLSRWDVSGIEERCEGWWPSLAAFVAEQMSGSTMPPPPELLGVLEAIGQSWIAEERFALLEEDGGGVFVIRVAWW